MEASDLDELLEFATDLKMIEKIRNLFDQILENQMKKLINFIWILQLQFKMF